MSAPVAINTNIAYMTQNSGVRSISGGAYWRPRGGGSRQTVAEADYQGDEVLRGRAGLLVLAF